MPRITAADISNHDESNEVSGYFTNKGTFEPHWPPKHKASVSEPHDIDSIVPPAEEEGDGPSAGTSSSTSASKPAKSGSSAPATERSTPSPVPDAESPSAKGPATKPARSSSVSSTAGSTRGTGASQRNRQGSSAASTDQSEEATPGPGDEDPK
jgi:hypothetical protein